MQTRIVFSLATAVALAACSNEAVVPTQIKAPAEPALTQQAAPLLASRASNPIPDQYIVVLHDNVDPVAVSVSHALATRYTYQHALRGFAAKLTRAQLDRLRSDRSVKYIEQDGTARFVEDASDARPADAPPQFSSQSSQANPPWGLDRLDQRTGFNANYTYTNTGAGVKVYVLGTGIRFTHQEFDGVALNRAKTGIDLITPGGPAADCNGHGTHMAGVIGGTTTGIAKGVTLYSVRVLDCAGTGVFSTVIAGVDWVTYNHLNPSVGHATLSGAFSQALNDAMTKSILYGTTWVATGGNGPVNACTTSPGSVPLAITVAASDSTDTRAAFTNSGPCIDLYAPGVNIRSAAITSDVAYVVWNGTADASAFVAGLAALFLQTKPTATPTEVHDVITLNAQPGLITGNPGGTPNLLANKQTGNCAVAGAYCSGISGNSQFPYIGGGQYYLSGIGMQRGYLRGTPGTNFDMELHEWNGAAWVLRVNSIAATTNPIIQFNSACAFGLANCFKMYKVKSAAGTGSFDFWYDRQ